MESASVHIGRSSSSKEETPNSKGFGILDGNCTNEPKKGQVGSRAGGMFIMAAVSSMSSFEVDSSLNASDKHETKSPQVNQITAFHLQVDRTMQYSSVHCPAQCHNESVGGV